MPIKAIKLRAGFLLLLFTLLFISSNSLITEVNADSLEESFKVTPIPFWEINNIDISTSYSGITQDVLFRYGEYFEDFNDISDWVEDGNCDQTSESTEDGILSFSAGNNGGTDYDYYLSNTFSDIGATPTYEARVKINTLDGIPMLRFYNVYPADYQSVNIPNNALDNWVIMSGTVNEAQNTRVGLGIITYPADNTVIIDIDYFIMYQSDDGTLNTSIPIKSFQNQKVEFMIDTENLTDSTKLEFGIFQNQEFMNYNFSLENKIFEQRDYSFNYTGYNYLRFKLDLKYSTNYFKLSCYDENNTKIFGNLIFESVKKLGNNFIIQSDNFDGWFYLYYFTGDVDYATIWTETIINLDSEIDYSMLSFSSWGDTDLDDHEIIHNRFISNFQFFRTNIYFYTDFSISISAELGTIIDIQFYHPDGSEFYGVNGKLFRTQNTFRFELEIYEGTSLIHSSAVQGLSAQEAFSTFQFAVWRTQDNRVGSFYTYDEAVFSNEPDGVPRYVTNYTLENFQANITITHFSEDIVAGYRNFESTLEGFELGYGRVEGVAEPHFSTTWWDSIPFLGQIINAFMLVGDAIILALEFGLSPITAFLDSIFGAIGGIAGSVWILFESALSDLGISIDAIALDVFGFFDSILNSIDGLISDVYTAITSLNDNFVAWVVEGITNSLVPALIDGVENIMDALFTLWEYQLNLVGTALGWGAVGTFLFDFTDSVVLIVPNWLTLIISVGNWFVGIFALLNNLIDTYGAMFLYYGALVVAMDITSAVITMDTDVIMKTTGRYLAVLEKIFTIALNIISMVLNAIWGILPF